jgi:methionyl-tRNA synthetase
MERFYVTTPIYYVNDRPHIGHAYTTILADVLARFHRSFGEETHFLTGVDEHGQKVQDAAEKRGMEPGAHCDEMSEHFRTLWPTLDVHPDDYIRTTEERHVRVVQKSLMKLKDAGFIYEKDYEGWYSPSVERYWTEKELKDGHCPESGKPVKLLKERNYFFKMSEFEAPLRKHIEDNPGFITPRHRRNEVLAFLDKGLRDLCISRPKSRLSWGIELPFDSDYVTYVWVDALQNYATAVGLHTDEALFGKWWPHVTHVIGKDILTTHCVYWNTLLMALGIPLPKRIVAHGWWLMDDSKMSKSLGNVVDPLSLSEKYGREVFRYFLMRDMTIGQDANFSEEQLVIRNNGDLANDLGNLLSRSTKLLRKAPFEQRVPEPGPHLAEDEEVVARISGLGAEVEGLVRDVQIHRAIDASLGVVRRLNKYINDTQPFRVVKDDPARAGAILYIVLEGLRHVAAALAPVIPEASARIANDIGCAEGVPALASLDWGGLEAGAPLSIGESLFVRREFVAEEEIVEDSTPAEVPAVEGKDIIAFEDFLKLDLVVGRVVSAEAVEGSNKLLKVDVDLGSESRQVVAGIAKSYDVDDLVGASVVMLRNLKPRKVFGVESQGMILAAEGADGALSVLTPHRQMPAGSEVS